MKFCKSFCVNEEKKDKYKSIERLISTREKSTSDITNIEPDEEESVIQTMNVKILFKWQQNHCLQWIMVKVKTV